MDTKPLDPQILSSIQSELQQLKSTLTPCIIFLNDILDIRKKRNIPESTSHSLLSLVLLDFKAELMKEIRPVYATMSQIDLIQDQIQETRQESLTVKELILKTDELVKDQLGVVAKLDKEIRESKDHLEDLKFQLDGKSTVSNLLELRQLIKNCASVSQLEIAKNRINDCAGKYQLEELQKNLIFVENRIKKFTKAKEVKKLMEDLKDELVVNTEKDFMSINMFNREKEGLLKRVSQSDEALLEVSNKIEKTESMLSKKVSMVKRQLDSVPWSSSISEIHNCLLEKSSFEDLQNFRQEINRVINKSSETIESFKRSIGNFEEIQARFDEILLLKAEKDDVYRIDQKILTLLEKTEYKLTIDPVLSTLERFQDALKKLIKSSDVMDKHIEVVSGKCNSLIKDNIDVTLVAKNLSDLRSVVDRKSNKEDIYEIYDLMARKMEIRHLVEIVGLSKKQLELCAVLVLSLCRTLVKNGENPLVIQKTREELLGSLNTLVNWIAGEQNTQKALFPSSKEEDKAKRSLSRSLPRRSQSISNDPKLTVDFPRIKMT